MILRGRLKLIAQKVPQCEIVIDVGTDHALIPIYLIKHSICKKAIASDIKKGPISAAEKNIISHKLSELIETRLGNGLECIKKVECDIVIIAGMGGILIKDILAKDLDKSRNAAALVLQPMNAPEILREWLYENCFEVFDEEMCAEGEKLYNVIVARWTGKQQNINTFSYYIGDKLIEKKDPLLGKYIKKKLKQLDKSIIEMKNSSESKLEAREKYIWLKNGLQNILEVINYDE